MKLFELFENFIQSLVDPLKGTKASQKVEHQITEAVPLVYKLHKNKRGSAVRLLCTHRQLFARAINQIRDGVLRLTDISRYFWNHQSRAYSTSQKSIYVRTLFIAPLTCLIESRSTTLPLLRILMCSWHKKYGKCIVYEIKRLIHSTGLCNQHNWLQNIAKIMHYRYLSMSQPLNEKQAFIKRLFVDCAKC